MRKLIQFLEERELERDRRLSVEKARELIRPHRETQHTQLSPEEPRKP